MASYKVKVAVECLTQPITGNKSGVWLKVGQVFESSILSGSPSWVKFAEKRWVPLSACEVVVVLPPDDEPDPPTQEERTILVLEKVDGVWANARYFKVKEEVA